MQGPKGRLAIEKWWHSVTVSRSTSGQPPSTEDGLSPYDRAEVTAAARLLPGTWFAQFGESPSGGSYVRLDQTGTGGRVPEFLLKRQDGFVVLTEFLSDQTRNRVTRHHSMTKAMRLVFATVLAHGAALDQGSRPSHAP